MGTLQCRLCGNGKTESLGSIPNCGLFAGQVVIPSIKGGELWQCKDCGSMFRYPTLSDSEYLAFYDKAPCGLWAVDLSWREDIATLYGYLLNHPGGSILDIGCYAGGFLTGLPERFIKFGVEPSKLAAEKAASTGIKVLGKTLADIDTHQTFDIVVAIDVVEHVLNVESFLAKALALVSKSGLLIISTGNPDCIFWNRIFKARFWYSSYAEHLVFPSLKFIGAFAQRHNLPPPEQICFKYGNPSVRKAFSILLDQLAFAISPARYSAKMKSLNESISKVEDIPLTAPGIFTDHQVLILKNR